MRNYRDLNFFDRWGVTVRQTSRCGCFSILWRKMEYARICAVVQVLLIIINFQFLYSMLHAIHTRFK